MSDSLGIRSPFVGSPGWEACCGVQNLHNSWRTSLVLLFSSLWVTHLADMRFDFIIVVPLLPSHWLLHCLWTFFWGGWVASLIAQLVKNPLQCSSPWFDSWVGKSPWRRERLPSPIFLGFPCGSAGEESPCNAGDLGLIPRLGRSPGEGNGYPLQYSGVENSMGFQRVRHDWASFTSHLFFVCSRVVLSLNVQQLIVILVFSQEEISACPSTLPSWRMMI